MTHMGCRVVKPQLIQSAQIWSLHVTAHVTAHVLPWQVEAIQMSTHNICFYKDSQEQIPRKHH